MPSLRFPWIPAVLLALWCAGLAGTAHAAGPGIDTTGLQGLLRDAPGSVFLLDVRTPREFADGRLPGSVLIPMNQVPGRLAEIPTNKKVVVVCATGARSAAVTNYLQQRGYPDAVNYVGGVVDWYRKGLQLER
ncbi:MAG TPA: rhodanese-like domain-containing protein [Deferrisomatales bacterium]|nr:rhodanese-like domain-containing protein [Deferrisomatales bacterium]